MKDFRIATPKDLDEILKDIEAAEFIAYDVETTGLNPRQDMIIGAAIAPKIGKAWYIPTFAWDLEEQALRLMWNDLLLDVLFALRGKKLLMHNGSFDCRFTYENHGIELNRFLHADTMLLKHTLDEERPFGLKDIAKKIQAHIGLDVSKEANEEQLQLKAHLDEVGASQTREKYELYKGNYQIIGKYACADVDLTFRVFEYYSKKLKEENLEAFFYEEEVMPLYREVTIPMETRGVPFDVKKCAELQGQIAADISALEQEILEIIDPQLTPFKTWYLNKEYGSKRSGGFAQAAARYFKVDLPILKSGNYSLSKKNVDALPDSRFKSWINADIRLEQSEIREIQASIHGDEPMFNIYSKDHLKRLFFTAMKLKPTTTTDKGNPQVNDEFLKQISDQYPWVKKLTLFNRLMKLKTAYYDRFAKSHENGMYYPSFQQHRTISGRYGSDIQQLPRPASNDHELIMKYQNPIRELFISGENHVFIDADYESLEPHVFAHVSGDPGLLDIFRKRHDFYSTIAIRTEGLSQYSADKKAENYLKKCDPDRRQKAKSYALGIPYGMSPYKLKFEIGVSEYAAKKLWADYLKSFPKLKQWMDQSERDCLTKGFVKSEAGRVRHMPSAVEIYKKYGDAILHDLELWKEYHDTPRVYAEAKLARRKLKNYLNNSKNFQIQSLATSIVNRSAIAINRYMWDNNIEGYVCAQIHDQLVVRVQEKHAELMRGKVEEIMQNTYKLDIDLFAPAEIGRNWAEAH